METTFTYEEALAQKETVLIHGRSFKADVFVARCGGRRYVIKDFTQKRFWERTLVGRIVTHREARAYASLAGIKGIPARFKRLSPFAFAVEFLEGTSFGSVDQEQVGPGVIAQFERIVEGIHERGWVHLDLHRRTNILLVDDKVFVVDLASALHPGMIPIIGRLFTRLIGLADRLSLIKMKTIFAPATLTPGERRLLAVRNRIMPSKWRV
jgi:hypothetical protein